jgi:hypothetical protein
LGAADPALHSEEGVFEGFYTIIITNTVSIHHVHHYV